MIYTIPHKPIPLARHRNHGAHYYNPQRELVTRLQFILKHQHGNRPFYEGPLLLKAIFHFTYPKTYSAKKRQGLVFHHVKPDKSNCEKFIEDMAQGILFENDSRIAWSNVLKVYGPEDKIEFTIIELDESWIDKIDWLTEQSPLSCHAVALAKEDRGLYT